MFSLKDKNLAKEILSNIKKSNLNIKLMHVCGTHQDTLVKHGLNSILKECGIEIIQGPGCPVCVTTPKEIEEMLLLAKNGKIVTSFGDMINVPGEKNSLRTMQTDGYDIRTVYGIEDAVKIAKENKKKDIVFIAVGFETTAPTTSTILNADLPENFSVLCCHRTIPNALKYILEMGEIKINGLIEPGHVSTIIGTKPYDFISKDYKIPQVITGFEPIDILMGVWMIVKQIKNDEAILQNEYKRAVHENGNIIAKKSIEKTFYPVGIKWRGFPVIPKSGLNLKDKYEKYDARKKYEDILYELKNKEFKEPKGCRCGELLRGLCTPFDCSLFGKKCRPETPVGPCMVSMEGSCNIEYRYSKK